MPPPRSSACPCPPAGRIWCARSSSASPPNWASWPRWWVATPVHRSCGCAWTVGWSACRTLMQATADLLGVPVDVYPSPHATALGVAAAGRLAGDASLQREPGRARLEADPDLRTAVVRRPVAALPGPMACRGRGHSRPGAVMTVYDVAVIGAGVVGAAIARELCGYELSVALVEARDDVGDGTSKANTAILHTGFDATPGTLESRLVRRGRDLLAAYAESTGIPVERTGALMVAWTQDELDTLPLLADKARRNGYDELRPGRCRRGLPPGARTRPGRARRPGRAGRIHHLHLDRDPGAGHRRPPSRRRAAARPPGCRGRCGCGCGWRRDTRHADHPAHGRWSGGRPVGRERGRSRQRRDRPHVRLRPLHRHPPPR